MTLTLRQRIFLTLVPLLLLLAVLGSAGVALLWGLGNSVKKILRENYDSVIAMERLNEALERIDSSFQIAMSGRHDPALQEKARRQYRDNWDAYRAALEIEQKNITLPGEAQLVEELENLTEEYRGRGKAFYAQSGSESGQQNAYYGQPDGLLRTFDGIKDVSGKILRLNQNNMETAGQDARRIAL